MDDRQGLFGRSATEGARYDAERERVLARGWHVFEDRFALGDASVHPCMLLPGSLDEPLLLTREADTRRVLANVCTHRGALLVDAGIACEPGFASLPTGGIATKVPSPPQLASGGLPEQSFVSPSPHTSGAPPGKIVASASSQSPAQSLTPSAPASVHPGPRPRPARRRCRAPRRCRGRRRPSRAGRSSMPDRRAARDRSRDRSCTARLRFVEKQRAALEPVADARRMAADAVWRALLDVVATVRFKARRDPSLRAAFAPLLDLMRNEPSAP